MRQFNLDANGNFKIVLLFEGTNNDPQNNPSAISELKYAYDWICANYKGERLDEEQIEKLKSERENKKSDNGVIPPEYRIYRKRELNYRRRLVHDPLRGQIVKLTSGSGTYGNTCCKKFGELFGRDWDVILKKQYRFLQDTINDLRANQQGSFDISKIHLYVFGFSRGAYQAKLFVNGISYYGINDSGDEFIRKIKNDAKSNLEIHKCIPTIDYLGLIDTVAAWDSLGGFVGKFWAPKDWACVGIPHTVKKCRHAVALNEYRPRFEPQLLHGDSRIEEQCFVGAHSDVGWAYNGQLDKTIKPGEPNEIPTRTFGKIVLTWLIEPVLGELSIANVDELLLNYKTTIDYIKLLATFPFILHDSYLERSNFVCSGKRRLGLNTVKPHVSLEMLRHMVKGRYFPNDGTIMVVKARYKYNGYLPVVGDAKETLLIDCYKDLLGITCQGDTPYVPCIQTGTDAAGRIIKEVLRKVFPAFWNESAFHEINAYGRKNLKLDLMEPDEERKKLKSYCDCRLLCNVISELEDKIKRGFI